MASRRRSFMLLSVAAGAIVSGDASVTPLAAAVRECRPLIAVPGAHPKLEVEARRQAIAQWIAAARQHGEGFARWQLADKRAVVCTPATGGGILYQAIGAPCIIRQAPGQPPAPKSKGLAI